MMLRDGSEKETHQQLTEILSDSDLDQLLQAPNPMSHVFNVLYAYLNSADGGRKDVTNLEQPAYGMTSSSLTDTLIAVEQAINKCISVKEFPISPAFTLHLRVFTIFWLALLPLTMVLHDGFIAFVFLLPISYSIINLLIIGDELSNPFGEDQNDIPLNRFCHEMQGSIHRLYHNTAKVKHLIQPSEYSRAAFSHQPVNDREGEEPEIITAKVLFSRMYHALPHVSITAMVFVTLWTGIAVVGSYFLARLWDDDRNPDNQRGWVSLIDVDADVLGNVAMALFLILTFRCFDAIKRYDNAARGLSQMGMHLRTYAVQIVQSFPDGSYHSKDKERIVAHLHEIPLLFCDILLDRVGKVDKTARKSLLSEADRKLLEESASPLDHLIDTVHSYSVSQDNKDRDLYLDRPFVQNAAASVALIERISKIRAITAQAFGIKRFPVVPSYKNHQRLFSALWLILLPLSKTNKTGFFTILWAPLIAYTVFALEEIASKLVDPLCDEEIDIPVNDVCNTMANNILQAVNSVEWDCNTNIHPSPKDSKQNKSVKSVSLHMNDSNDSNETGLVSVNLKDPADQAAESADQPAETKRKPSLLNHFVRSVPWFVILIVTAWTTIACIISYFLRRTDIDDRWWVSRISVDTSVPTFLSIGTFALLGFYTNSAFGRYQQAGTIWGDQMKTVCHTMTTLFLSYVYPGSFHEGDQERIVGHIAAIPIVLKEQLRDGRDIREVQKFLSHDDVGKIQCAPNMALYCIDVLRSYLLKYMCDESSIDQKNWPTAGSCALYLGTKIDTLEDTIRQSFFIKRVSIPPGAFQVLRLLVVIWFIILPFAFAETSGWFSILWVPIIAYGVIGTYSIANEIAQPFGNDVNDLDLDSMARAIVKDVFSVWEEQKDGFDQLTIEKPITQFWSPEPAAEAADASAKENEASKKPINESDDDSAEGGKSKETIDKDNEKEAAKAAASPPKVERLSKMNASEKMSVGQVIRLALHGVQWHIFLVVVAWAAAATTLSYFVGRWWKSEPDNCDPWICSRIAVDPSIKKFVGFGLFLLLGFRCNFSHSKYILATDMWRGGLVGTSLVPCVRMMQTYTPGIIHSNDRERFIGHVAAFLICLNGTLHGVVYKERLLEVLSEDDVNSILAANDPVDRCTDVIWAYLRSSERFVLDPEIESPVSFWEHYQICRLTDIRVRFGLVCRQLLSVKMPLGYVRHLRIFLVIWIGLLPFGLVESSGWLSILWVPIIAYGLIAVETWADELSDPFGFDISDVDIDEASNTIIGIVKGKYLAYSQGLDWALSTDRPALRTVRR